VITFRAYLLALVFFMTGAGLILWVWGERGLGLLGLMGGICCLLYRQLFITPETKE
jgi:hypothetical protein